MHWKEHRVFCWHTYYIIFICIKLIVINIFSTTYRKMGSIGMLLMRMGRYASTLLTVRIIFLFSVN